MKNKKQTSKNLVRKIAAGATALSLLFLNFGATPTKAAFGSLASEALSLGSTTVSGSAVTS